MLFVRLWQPAVDPEKQAREAVEKMQRDVDAAVQKVNTTQETQCTKIITMLFSDINGSENGSETAALWKEDVSQDD